MCAGILRKLDLEIFLSRTKPHPSPKIRLEQYTIPVETAASILFLVANVFNDVKDKEVLDLGCGTGRLALGAAYLGARNATGVDIDREALKTAIQNSELLNFKAKCRWVIGDIDVLRGHFDTVIQNPPFGVQRKRADRRFLKKALELGSRVYTLHKNTRKGRSNKKYVVHSQKTNFELTYPAPFIERFVTSLGGRILAVYSFVMTIPHMFRFHKKRKHSFLVDLYVINSLKK